MCISNRTQRSGYLGLLTVAQEIADDGIGLDRPTMDADPAVPSMASKDRSHGTPNYGDGAPRVTSSSQYARLS